MPRILIVDDEPDILSTLSSILSDPEYEIYLAASGPEALDILSHAIPDLVILDIIMPDMSGIEVCRRIRADPYTSKVPILFLTAKGRAVDVADGLDAGGDDYLIKPFEVVELPARVRALLRRSPGGSLDTDSDTLTVNRLTVTRTQPQIDLDGAVVELTAIEHKLVYYLMLRSRQPVSAEQLLQDVWGYPPGTGSPNLVQVTIGRLRRKLQDVDPSEEYVGTVRGQGYIIT